MYVDQETSQDDNEQTIGPMSVTDVSSNNEYVVLIDNDEYLGASYDTSHSTTSIHSDAFV
jgi:hypothetical protein